MGFCLAPDFNDASHLACIGSCGTDLGTCNCTTVLTVDGPKRIDRVGRGDALETLAFGTSCLEWVGSTVVSHDDILDMPYLAPIKIETGALGQGLPTGDLFVSQQQRLFVTSVLADQYFASYEALLPAVELLRLPGVTIAEDFSEVIHFHLLFDTQEFIWVNGVLTEILYSDQNQLQDRSPDARREVAVLFPEALDPQYI